MASSKNVNNAKEIIEYYNRKFTVTTTGAISGADGFMKFKLPPLNETAFSNNYSQCLCRIKEIQIANLSEATLADNVNPVFVGIPNATGLLPIQNGLILKTSIPCRNIKHTASNFENAIWGAENYFDTSFHQSFSCEVKSTYITNATALDGRTALGSNNVLFTPNIVAAGNPQFQISESNHYYHFMDNGGFEDGATLIGNPFGQEHSLSILSAYNGEKVQLASGLDLARGRGSTMVRVKFEFLMLENPTPNDR